MSILIKGMKMPKDGCHHIICIYADGTVATGIREYKAIPIPPHGRLIDADELTISTAVPLDGKPYQYVHINNIKGAPTIISAEPPKEK